MRGCRLSYSARAAINSSGDLPRVTSERSQVKPRCREVFMCIKYTAPGLCSSIDPINFSASTLLCIWMRQWQYKFMHTHAAWSQRILYGLWVHCTSQSIRSCSGTWAEKQYDQGYDDTFVNSTVQHQEIAGGPSPRVPENHLSVIFEGSAVIRTTYISDLTPTNSIYCL